jgi:hypothetical protein
MKLRLSLLPAALLIAGIASAQQLPPATNLPETKPKLSRAQRFKNRLKTAIELTYQQHLLRQQQQAAQQQGGQHRVLTTHDVTGTVVNSAGACTSSGCVYSGK